ncbi:hypothetical protein TaPaz_81 [Acinetobacter phage TaPaz]|nr:hypothetical protein TaPaz_81 [Acinetobacter phage TaPaz]
MLNRQFESFEVAKIFALQNSLIAGMCEYFIYQNENGKW